MKKKKKISLCLSNRVTLLFSTTPHASRVTAYVIECAYSAWVNLIKKVHGTKPTKRFFISLLRAKRINSNFRFWHFSSTFVQLTIVLSGNTVWPQATVFPSKNSPNVNVARFARNVVKIWLRGVHPRKFERRPYAVVGIQNPYFISRM